MEGIVARILWRAAAALAGLLLLAGLIVHFLLRARARLPSRGPP
ncbi:MAG TPA: hypothetical protein VFD38_10340 [Myxococcaceae bacterium]|nr:hypothetical protein [Myxococcaceae bacterium]